MPAIEAGDVVWRVYGDTSDLRRAIAEVETNMNRAFGQMQRQIGAAMISAGAAITGALGMSARAAISWESAFIGVQKTTTATAEEFAALERGLIDMSMEIPVAATELAKFAEIGGQMGVPREQLLAFTKVIAILGETTNLAGEQGAAMLAQFANVAQVPQGKYSNLAAAIVDLGNAGTSTEFEILAMGQRIAAAGGIAGMTAGDILGLANALVGVGIEAEAGGTAMSKVIMDMTNAVAQGGKHLEALAAVAGMAAQQFAAAFNEDPAAAIVAFVQGLARIQAEGGNVFAVLDSLGYSEIRLRNALLSSAQAAGTMADSVALGNAAFVENNAHLVEAEKRFASTESQITLFKNSVTALAIEIGNALLPGITARVQLFKEWAQGAIEAARAHPELVAQLVQFASVLGFALLAVGAVVMALPGLTIAIGALTWPVAATGVAIAALIGVLIAAGVAAYQWARGWMAIPENMAIVNAALAQAGEWIAGTWNWIVGVFQMAVEWIGGLLDRFVAWTMANWAQIIRIFTNAKDGLLLTAGILWEGLQLAFSLLWEFLSRVFGEIGEGFIDVSGVASDGSATFLDVVEALQEKSIYYLTALSAAFEKFTNFLYYIWPLISGAMEIGANLFIEPMFNMLDWMYWIADKIAAIMNGIGGVWNSLFGDSGLSGGININGQIPALASGGEIDRAGWALVGERGPELVSMPRGATVYDAEQTQGAMQGGGQTVNITNNFGRDSVRSDEDIDRIERRIADSVAGRLRSAGAFA